jgi:SAM-dependent methyltransferase
MKCPVRPAPDRDMFNYLSFGFIPTGRPWPDFVGSLRGAPNLLKRLQARRLLELLAPRPGERILDFGCGAGFFTVECARRGADATGVDIRDFPLRQISTSAGQARFVTVKRGEPLPFPDGAFDKVLMSEVFVALDDPRAAARELCRVLAPGGRITVLNTLGRLQIRDAYERNSVLVRWARKRFHGAPADYPSFCLAFLRSDRLARLHWHEPAELRGFLEQAGFGSLRVETPFRGAAFPLLYGIQFLKLCAGGGIALKFSMPAYLLLEALNACTAVADASTVVIEGTKP